MKTPRLLFTSRSVALAVATLTLLAPDVRAEEPEPTPSEARLLLGGNYPDATVLKDGDDYYMTHSSFEYQPGLLIWHSRDLKSWKPVTHAIKNFESIVWAPELIRHDGRYFLYYPGKVGNRFANWVVYADDIRGPWSEPRALGVNKIDPGHVVDDEGNRYIHLSGGYVVDLSDDGLSAVGEPRKVHEGWPIPEDWAVECFCLESPKFTKRNGWYHLTAAQGGTFGPSTSHMATSFRSRTPLGPWESSPHNPVVHTWDRSEPWWSKGHGTLVEAPDGNWFMVLHGIRNGYRTAGRSTLIEAIAWTENDWYRTADEWPEGWSEFNVDMPLSDSFDGDELGIQWQFYEHFRADRFELREGTLVMKGRGKDPGVSEPLAVNPRDLAYEIETEVEVRGDARAGLMLFSLPGNYIGLSIDSEGKTRREQEGYKRYHRTDEPRVEGSRVAFRIVNDRQDVRFYVRPEGGEWRILGPSMEISQGGTVRAALFVSGEGEATFESFDYRALDVPDSVSP